MHNMLEHLLGFTHEASNDNIVLKASGTKVSHWAIVLVVADMCPS